MSSGANERAWRLVADVGGTNARFALVDDSGILHHARTLPCQRFAGLAEAAEHYLRDRGVAALHAAAIAVATPVTGNEVRLTNGAKWRFTVDGLRQRLGLRRVQVLNDFTALALSLPRLGGDGLRQVGGGMPQDGNAKAVVGPGTGLGVSALIPAHGEWIALASEGGHVTLSAATAHELRLQRVLQARFVHVSAERVLSGPGLTNLYGAHAALAGSDGGSPAPEEITERGLREQTGLCRDVLTDFCAMLGSAAANVALTLGARGGVYIGGGIVPRLGQFFDTSPFRRRFEAHGRFSAYLAAIPTYVITASHPALLGAAAALARTAAR